MTHYRSIFITVCVLSSLTLGHGTESFDIVPREWLTGVGCKCSHVDLQTDSKTALIFPSLVENGGETALAVTLPLPGLLAKNNRMPIKETFKAQKHPSVVIKITRTGTFDVTLLSEKSSVAAIRRLGWEEFQDMQREFACWLIRLNEPKFLLDHLKTQAEGFKDLDGNLLKFWGKVTSGSKFEQFIRNIEVKSRFFPPWASDKFPSYIRLPKLGSSTESPGKKVGAILLRPGVRLAIHWGGTANYSLNKLGYPAITRQTTGGSSFIMVSEMDFAKDQTTGLGLTSSSRVSLKALPAYAVPAPPQFDPAKYLPFGIDNEVTRHITPVWNEFDLHVESELRNSGLAKSLVVLIPDSYPMADSGESLSVVTQDAHLGKEIEDKPTKKSVYHRFALFGSKQSIHPIPGAPIGGIQTSSPSDSLREFDFKVGESGQDFKPLVFGNQTWIDVEQPVSLNGQMTQWVGLQTTAEEFLMTYAPALLFPRAGTDTAVLSFTRVRLPSATKGATETYDSQARFTFWMTPSQEHMGLIELLPSDSFHFTP